MASRTKRYIKPHLSLTAPGQDCSEHKNFFEGTTEVRPGLFVEWLDHQQCHHTNALLDLPRLPGKSVQKSQKTLYLFLLLVGPGDWDFSVQIFNILFLQTSHFCVSSIGTRFPALPLGSPVAEASLRALSAEQDVFPKERKAIIAKLRELQAMDEVFIGQGFSIGKGWTVIGLLDIIQEIAEKVAGINIRDMKTAGSDVMGQAPVLVELDAG